MESWQLALAIAIPVAAILAALVATAYFYAIPRFLIAKIRSGEDNVKYPDDYDEISSRMIVERDLKYASAYPANTYDLYRPKNGEPKGLVVWMHGGFFIAGDKKGVENVCSSIAADGFCVAAINYVTAPEYKYPKAIIQLDEAIAHLISKYGDIAEKGLFLAGDSAGGQIVAHYSALTSSPELRDEMRLSPVISAEKISGTVLVCAPIDISKLLNAHKTLDKLLPIFGRAYYGRGKWHKYDKFKSTKLFDYIGCAFPPSFITDGNNVSFEGQNKALAALLDEKGVYNEKLFFDTSSYGKIDHEYLFDLSDEPARSALELLIAFLNRRIMR